MALFDMAQSHRGSISDDDPGPTPPKRIRLFAAINLPESVKAALIQCQRGLASRIEGDSIRWTNQLHLTLKFFGHIEESSAGELEKVLAKSCQGVAPFELNASGLGCFPSARSPRVVWAGIAGELAPLLALQNRIDETTVDWAEPEKREFTPHLTLARVKDPGRKETQTIASFLEANRRLA